MNNMNKYYIDNTGGTFHMQCYQMQDLVDNGFIQAFIEVSEVEFIAHLTGNACLYSLDKPTIQGVW